MKKLITTLVASLSLALVMPFAAFAHVVVTPNSANIGDKVAFTVSVPNEKESAVTQLKLAIPSGVSDVQPDVKGGWTIITAKKGDEVTSITWAGQIPAGQRADFSFKAQVPATASDITWKAYQTYADGTTVSWDQTPSANQTDNDAATSGPYSITKVVDDTKTATSATDQNQNTQTSLAFVFSIAALAFSILALFWRRRK